MLLLYYWVPSRYYIFSERNKSACDFPVFEKQKVNNLFSLKKLAACGFSVFEKQKVGLLARFSLRISNFDFVFQIYNTRKFP